MRPALSARVGGSVAIAIAIVVTLLTAGCESDTPPPADTPDAAELTVAEFNDLSLPQQYDVIEVFVADHPDECGGISDPTGEDLRDDVRNRAIGSEDSRSAGEVILEVCAEY